MFEKKYKNLTKHISKDFNAECGVCLLIKNGGDFIALIFNNAVNNDEYTLGMVGNLNDLNEKSFNDKMINLLEIAFELKETDIEEILKKNSTLVEFSKKDYRSYINEYKNNLENGWHIISLKFIPHLEEYDKYVNSVSIVKYGFYNKYRISDKFLVCEVRPLSPTCNKLIAHPRDNEIFDIENLDNLLIYEKVKEIINRRTVENVYFLENNYKDIELKNYPLKHFEEEKNKRKFFHLPVNLYIRENGDFVAYSGTNKRQSSLVNYIQGNFNEISNEDLSKIIIKILIDALNENDFLEDLQIERKDNIVANYHCADYKKDKSIGAKWFAINISNNHPGEIIITTMKQVSSTEWGGSSRHSVLLNIDSSINDVVLKLRELFDYKHGALLTKTDVKGNILESSSLSHFPIKDILQKHDFEYLDKTGLSAVGFDFCVENEEFVTYPFLYKGQDRLYLNRRHAYPKNGNVDSEIYSIIDFALNDGIYYDLKSIEFVDAPRAEDKIEVKLLNLPNDNKYHLTTLKNNREVSTKIVARTKIVNMLALIQDFYKNYQ